MAADFRLGPMRVARTDFRVLGLEVFLFIAMKLLCRELHKRQAKSLSGQIFIGAAPQKSLPV